MEEALAEIGQAMQLDPISPTVNSAAGRALCYARQYEASVEQLLKAIELDPHLALAHFYLGQTYTLQGRYEEALAAFNKALEIFSNFPWATSYIGHVYGRTGERGKARKILRKWEERRMTLPVPTAVIYLELGEDDKVFEWLERDYEEVSHRPCNCGTKSAKRAQLTTRPTVSCVALMVPASIVRNLHYFPVGNRLFSGREQPRTDVCRDTYLDAILIDNK